MAMLDVVYRLSTQAALMVMAQADRLGSKVSGHWRYLCSHRVNQVNSHSALSTMTTP